MKKRRHYKPAAPRAETTPVWVYVCATLFTLLVVGLSFGCAPAPVKKRPLGEFYIREDGSLCRDLEDAEGRYSLCSR